MKKENMYINDLILKGKCTHFKNKIFILHDFRMYTDVNKKKYMFILQY